MTEQRHTVRPVALTLLLVVSVVAIGISVSPVAGAGATDVGPQDPDQTVEIGETTTYTIAVSNVSDGVGSFNVNTSVDQSIATIEDISVASGLDPGVEESSVANDGSSASLKAAGLDTNDTGSVAIATVTVNGSSVGQTAVDIQVETIGDENFNSYTTTVDDGTLTVQSDTRVAVDPQTQSIDEGSTGTYDIVVTNVPGNGIGSFNVNTSVDQSIATIEDISVASGLDPGVEESSVANDGSSASLKAAGLNTNDTGSVAIATVTVNGSSVGQTAVDIQVETIGDENFNSIPTTPNNGSITVEESAAADLSVTDVTVSDQQPVVGDDVTVTATVENAGDVAGNLTVDFTQDSQDVATESVTNLAGGANTTVSTTISFSQAGSATAGANGQTVNLTVQSPATFEVSDLSAPASAVQGNTITVNATVSNVGDVEGTTDAEFVFGGDVLLNQTVTLSGGNSTSVSFDVSTADVAPGTYEHGVQAGNGSQFANITLQQPATFEVSGLSAPANATAGDTITVNATVSNVGDVEGTTDAEFVFGGDVLLNQTVTLGAGNATDVSFDVPVEGIQAGTYEHGVQAGTGSQFANITVQTDAEFEVSGLSAPASATVGDTITVDATVSNVGEGQGTITAEFVFAGDVLLNQTVTLSAGNGTNVSFSVPTADVAPGTYEHGVQAGAGSQFANITLQQPATFEVSGLSAPASATVGDTITVDATVSNVGDVAGTTDAEFVFAGDVLLNQSVTLDGGNSTTVSFDVPTTDVPAGTYEHGVQAGAGSQFANITLQQPATFEVSGLSAPASATVGDTITVDATVSNVGDVAGTTDAEFVFAGDVLLNQSVTLDGGNSTTVSFDVPTTDVPAGTYEHGVQAGTGSQFANITLQQPVATVTFDNQTVSDGATEVTVASAQFGDGDDGDFVVVVHQVASDGSIGAKIGESDILSSGTHSDITVDLQALDGGVNNITESQELVAMLHTANTDNGNNHGAAIVRDGAPVTDRADITVSDPVDASAPGFGIVAVFVAILSTALLLRRRS